MILEERIANLLQHLQDSTVNVARMTPYGPYPEEFIQQVTHLQCQLETMQTQTQELQAIMQSILTMKGSTN